MYQRRFPPPHLAPGIRRAAYLEQRAGSSFTRSSVLILILVFQLLFTSCIVAFAGSYLFLNLWDRALRQQELQQLANLPEPIYTLAAPALTDTPTETPTVLPQPTSPLTPTSTETPTNTPDFAPTATPIVVEPATATPNFIPTETLTIVPPIDAPGAPTENESAAYVQTVLPATQRLTEAARVLDNQLQASQLDDQNWRLNVAANLAVVQDAHQQLALLQPPASLAVAHASLLSATTACSTVTQSVTFAIDSSDANLLAQVVPQVRSCIDGVTNAFAQLQPLLPQP